MKPYYSTFLSVSDYSAPDAFCDAIELVGDDGQRIKHLEPSRLRKTFKAKRYRDTGGQLEVFADDHSPQVAFAHYANIEAMRHLHEATVSHGIDDAKRAASTVRILTVADEELLLSGNVEDVARRTRLPLPVIAQLRKTSSDTWLCRCKNPFAGPFAPKGKLCPSATWACLHCENAVFVPSKLASLLSYLRQIEYQRTMLEPKEWTLLCARDFLRLTKQILPQFPRKVVDKAKLLLDSSVTSVTYLPPNLRSIR